MSKDGERSNYSYDDIAKYATKRGLRRRSAFFTMEAGQLHYM